MGLSIPVARTLLTLAGDQNKLQEVLNVVEIIKDEFLKVDWDWFGLQDLCDDGRIDTEMYKRMWLASKSILGWEIDLEFHVDVFMILEDLVSSGKEEK